MEIVYCDVCGFRIPEEDLSQGRAIRTEEKLYCAKCGPKQAPPKSTDATLKKITSLRIPPADKRPSGASAPVAAHAPVHSTPAHARPVHETATAMRHHPPQSSSGSGVVIAAVLAVIVLVGAALFLGMGSKPDKPKSGSGISLSSAPEISTAQPSRQPPSTQSNGPKPRVVENNDPSVITGLGVMKPNKDDPDQRASDALDEMLKKLQALPETDEAARNKLMQDFVAAWPDSIVTGRVRTMLENIGKPEAVPAPLVPAAEPLASAAPAHPPVLEQDGLPAIGKVLIQETFDDPNAENIGHATIGDGPPGANGKVAILKGTPTYVKVALVNWFKRNGASPRNFDWKAVENARVRVRYYSENARDIEWLLATAGPPETFFYKKDDKAAKKKWTVIDVALSDFTAPDGRKVAPGTLLNTTQFSLGVSNNNQPTAGYVDEFIVYTPVASAPAPAQPQPSADTGPITFVKKDEKRGGDWKADLGKAGYVFYALNATTGNQTDHEFKLPPFISAVDNDGISWRWGDNAERTGLEHPGTGTRQAACMYSKTEIVVKVTARNQTPYRVALYCLDYDRSGRSERVDAVGENGKVASSIELPSLGDGVWLHYLVKGSVTFKIVNIAGGNVNAVMSGIFFDEDKEAAAAVAASSVSKEGYAVFQENLLELLVKRDWPALQALTTKAQKDEALKADAALVEQDARLAALLATYPDILAASAEKLKNVDSFELKLARGESMLVGKKGKFQAAEIKDGTLMLSTQGAQVPVAFDSLDRGTRDALILQFTDSTAMKALLLLIKNAEGDRDYTAAMARKALKDAEAAGASEAAAIARHLDVITKRNQSAEAKETAAAGDWRDVQKALEAKKWKQADLALQAFRKLHETTKFYASRAADIKAAIARIEENTRLEKGLIGWWKLDEGKGEIAADSSGNKNDGRFAKGTLWTKGKLDGAALFDGIDDYIEIPTSETFNINGAMTVACWFRYDGKANADYGRIVGKAWTDAAAPWMVWSLHLDKADVVPSRACFGIAHSDNTGVEMWSREKLQTGQWYHIAGVFDPAALKILLYVNGTKDAEQAVKLPDLAVRNTPIRIGDDATMNQRIKGGVDDVRVYNRALSEAEIQALASGKK